MTRSRPEVPPELTLASVVDTRPLPRGPCWYEVVDRTVSENVWCPVPSRFVDFGTYRVRERTWGGTRVATLLSVVSVTIITVGVVYE